MDVYANAIVLTKKKWWENSGLVATCSRSLV